MKILLIGRTGQLGGDLLRSNPGHAIDAPARDDLDVCSRAAIDAAVRPGRYDWVINTAAFHDLPRCEVEPETAFRVNCVAVRDLATACARAGTGLVTFSTDYVFGGDKQAPYTESDVPCPLQIYGITRLAGEYAARSAAPQHAVVVRTCGLYGAAGARSKGGNFVDRRVAEARAAGKGEKVEMGNDQVVSPTSTVDLGSAILQLLSLPRLEPGLYHLANQGTCTWYEFTRAIYDIMGFSNALVPVDRAGRTGDMRRPRYSALASTKAAACGVTLPPWRDALERYLVAKYGADPRT